MPNTTEFFGELITNFGPLTTTYTSPASCSTGTDHVWIANASQWNSIIGQPTCSVRPWGDCIPSGSVYDDLVRNGFETATQPFIHYYSPGLHCPSGWTTARTLAYGESPYTQFEESTRDPRIYAGLPRANIWPKILSESETMAYCCPSGYSADLNRGCWSSLGPFTDFDYSSICWIYVPSEAVVPLTTFEGSIWTPVLLSLTPVTNDMETQTVALPTTGTMDENWAIVTLVPGVPLVAQPSDTSSANNGSDNESQDKGSVASVAFTGPGSIQLIVVLFSMLVGAGLFVVW